MSRRKKIHITQAFDNGKRSVIGWSRVEGLTPNQRLIITRIIPSTRELDGYLIVKSEELPRVRIALNIKK